MEQQEQQQMPTLRQNLFNLISTIKRDFVPDEKYQKIISDFKTEKKKLGWSDRRIRREAKRKLIK
jgi:hypothetical protein